MVKPNIKTKTHFLKKKIVASKSEEGQTNKNVSRIKNGFQKIRLGNLPVLVRGTIALMKHHDQKKLKKEKVYFTHGSI